MKRLLSAAAVLALALVFVPGSSAASSATAAGFAHHHGALPAVGDDPVPVDCPFCGGDATLHVKRMNAIAVKTSRLAYRVLDASLF